jgi:RNA polymerase sigma factor (sigma-70 family)
MQPPRGPSKEDSETPSFIPALGEKSSERGIKLCVAESHIQVNEPSRWQIRSGHMRDLHDFERLALAQLDAAYNVAYWLVGNRADAQDVVQDAYLRAFRAFDSFTGEDIKPWLLTIVRNVAYRWLSVRKRTANVISLDSALSNFREDDQLPEMASEEPSAEDVLIGRAEQALVRSALTELAPAFREMIVLRELEGLSYQEIAKVMGIPLGTVMSRLARARDQLRDRLTQVIAKEDKNAL